MYSVPSTLLVTAMCYYPDLGLFFCVCLSLLRWIDRARRQSLTILTICLFVYFVCVLLMRHLPLPPCFLNSWSFLRGCTSLSVPVIYTSVCLCYLSCELGVLLLLHRCSRTFPKGSIKKKKKKITALERLSVLGRQGEAGDLQSDLAFWIRFWALSTRGIFWRTGAANGGCALSADTV